MAKYAIVIHEIGRPDPRGAPHHRFVEALWSDHRPYPAESYRGEREAAEKVESLIQKPGTYLVVTTQLEGGSLFREHGPVTWSYTVTVTPAPAPPPTITWRM